MSWLQIKRGKMKIWLWGMKKILNRFFKARGNNLGQNDLGKHNFKEKKWNSGQKINWVSFIDAQIIFQITKKLRSCSKSWQLTSSNPHTMTPRQLSSRFQISISSKWFNLMLQRCSLKIRRSLWNFNFYMALHFRKWDFLICDWGKTCKKVSVFVFISKKSTILPNWLFRKPCF